MARSMWRGALSFGMVAIPTKVYKATDDGKGVSFRSLCPHCQLPIKAPRTCPQTGEPVQGDTLKGFEVSKDSYVLVDDQELDQLGVPSLHTITLDQFITPPGGSAIALWTQGSYYLEPEPVGAQAFALLRAALEQTRRWGVGKIALRDREHLCVVAPHGAGLLLATLAWPQDVRGMGELKLPAAAVDEKMLAMAVQLIDNLTAAFEPGNFRDNYRDAVEAYVAQKQAGQPVSAPLAPAKGIEDLMEQLRASMAAGKAVEAA